MNKYINVVGDNLAALKLGFLSLMMFCLFPSIILAQTKNINYNNQQWFQYYNEVKINDKLYINSDIGYRFKDLLSQKTQYILRTALTYKKNKNVQFSIGFANLGYNNSTTWNKFEYRPHQELIIKNPFGSSILSHRFRMEQRIFRTNLDENQGVSNTFFFRFRYRFLFNLPIFTFPNEKFDQKLFLQLGDEILIHAGKQAVYNIFDQNRILAGVSLKLAPNLSVSATYSHQFKSLNSPNNYKQDYILWIGIKQQIQASSN